MANDKIRNLESSILSDNWYTLRKLTYEYLRKDGSWEKQEREAYDRGNGAVILLYNKNNNNVILTKQFRAPTYINGNDTGMMIEACAGLLDGDNPEDCIKRETEEETGYNISSMKKIYEIYMSPGSVTEILYFFIAEYNVGDKVSEGGGAESESENIDVLEMPINRAMAMIDSGEIKDAKTIILLQYLVLNNIL